MSADRLSRATVGYDGVGISTDTIKSLERTTHRGEPLEPKQPDLRTLEAIAYGLGIDPTEIPQYNLARARQLLSERDPAKGGVGLEQALANLSLIEGALHAASGPPRIHEVSPAADTDPRPRAASRGDRSPQGD